MSNTEAMRKAFEADVIKDLANIFDYSRMFERDLTGKYLSYMLQKRWDSWQAATALATAAQWICVDERMPINGARVLALGIYPDYPPQGADIYTAVFDDVYEVFELNPSPHADEYDTVQLSAVTHWQPLPQPPLRKGEALEGEQ